MVWLVYILVHVCVDVIGLFRYQYMACVFLLLYTHVGHVIHVHCDACALIG